MPNKPKPKQRVEWAWAVTDTKTGAIVRWLDGVVDVYGRRSACKLRCVVVTL